MVDPALQSAIDAMSLDERLELLEYIQSTVDVAAIEVNVEQRAMIRARSAELQTDPFIGLSWDELGASGPTRAVPGVRRDSV
jgi:putative addiction module component (TIGR02574 family)